MVLEHALIHAAGDREHQARLGGAGGGRAGRPLRPPRVVAVKHEGRRISIRLRVVLRPAS
jgi:hypothetical protein